MNVCPWLQFLLLRTPPPKGGLPSRNRRCRILLEEKSAPQSAGDHALGLEGLNGVRIRNNCRECRAVAGILTNKSSVPWHWRWSHQDGREQRLWQEVRGFSIFSFWGHFFYCFDTGTGTFSRKWKSNRAFKTETPFSLLALWYDIVSYKAKNSHQIQNYPPEKFYGSLIMLPPSSIRGRLLVWNASTSPPTIKGFLFKI